MCALQGALKYFQTVLQPEAGCAGAAAGVRSGFNKVFPDVLLGGCVGYDDPGAMYYTSCSSVQGV